MKVYKSTGGLVCSRCENEPVPGQRYCRSCSAAYMREWRRLHKLTPEQKFKDSARSYAGVYLRRGKLQRQPCKVIGCEQRAQMHHPDYLKPLEVEWLCRFHHLELHMSEAQIKKLEFSLWCKAQIAKVEGNDGLSDDSAGR